MSLWFYFQRRLFYRLILLGSKMLRNISVLSDNIRFTKNLPTRLICPRRIVYHVLKRVLGDQINNTYKQ